MLSDGPGLCGVVAGLSVDWGLAISARGHGSDVSTTYTGETGSKALTQSHGLALGNLNDASCGGTVIGICEGVSSFIGHRSGRLVGDAVLS